MLRKALLAAPLALALASPAMATTSPVFGHATVKPMTVTQAQSVKGKGTTSLLYGYYGLYYLYLSAYYANVSQYNNGIGQSNNGQNTYYYAASNYAYNAYYYLYYAGYYSVNGQ